MLKRLSLDISQIRLKQSSAWAAKPQAKLYLETFRAAGLR
jgi:hypothetical protein